MSRSLRIGLISDDFPGRKGCGGVGTYTYVLARGLSRLGHRVHVITRDWGKVATDDVEGVTVHRLPVSQPSAGMRRKFGETWQIVAWNLAVNRLIRRIREDEGLDIVECPECRAQGLLTTLFQPDVPVVVRLHGGGHYSRLTYGVGMGWSRWDTWSSELLERAMVRHARGVVSASAKLAAWCAKLFDIDARGIRNIPLPVDDDLFSPNGFVGDGAPTLLYVGRISAVKGVDTLIEALPTVLKGNPDSRVRLVGREERGHPAIERFRRKLLERGVAERAVEFLGPVRRTALPDVYRDASICLVPSPGGSSGYSCLEAMACGNVVVAAADDKRHGVIVDGVNGILVPPRSPDALIAATRRLLEDAALRRRLGRNATETIRQRFASRVVCSEIAATYASLLA